MSETREESALRERLLRIALHAALARHRVPLAGREVLEASGGGARASAPLSERGATVSTLDPRKLAASSVGRSFDVVAWLDPARDALDQASWERALSHLVEALRPAGWLLLVTGPRCPASEVEVALLARGLVIHENRATHHWTGAGARPPAVLRPFPGLLARVDQGLVMTGLFDDGAEPRLILARRPADDRRARTP